MDVTPEVFAFSETTQEILRLRISVVTSHENMQHHLDDINAAINEINEERLSAACARGTVRTRIHEIEAEFYAAGNKIKDAERQIAADKEHMGLKALALQLEAIVDYCDSAEGVLKNKYFEIKAKMRLS